MADPSPVIPDPTSQPLSRVLPGGWLLPEDASALRVARPAVVLPRLDAPRLADAPRLPDAQLDGAGGTARPPRPGALPRQRSESATTERGGWTPPPVRLSLTRTDGLVMATEGPVTTVVAAVAAAHLLPLHQARSAGVPWRRPAIAGTVVALLAAVTAAAPTFGEDTTSVSVIIDGTARTISAAPGSVGDTLASVGIQVGPRDVIAPAVTAPIGAGATISIRRGRLVTVTVDGERRQRWTTATTVEAALVELGLNDSDYQLSADRSRTIGTDGISFSGRSLHAVTVVDGAHPAQRLRLPAATVAQVLAQRNMSLGKFDRVWPAPSTAVGDGQQIVVTRVAVKDRTTTSPIAEPGAIVKQDASLGKGTTTVTQRGRAGTRSIQIRTTVTNGKAAEKVLADTVARQARPEITSVGTRETGRPESWSVPWDKMAFCESTSRWDVNTGNGTYGGIQFMTPTWLANGGGEFAPRADLATKEQQIIVGERLYAKEGLAPWHCARLLGWGFDRYEGPLPG